jgi:hypothetical protein
MDAARLDGMPEYKNEIGAFRELGSDQQVSIPPALKSRP